MQVKGLLAGKLFIDLEFIFTGRILFDFKDQAPHLRSRELNMTRQFRYHYLEIGIRHLYITLKNDFRHCFF